MLEKSLHSFQTSLQTPANKNVWTNSRARWASHLTILLSQKVCPLETQGSRSGSLFSTRTATCQRPHSCPKTDVWTFGLSKHSPLEQLLFLQTHSHIGTKQWSVPRRWGLRLMGLVLPSGRRFLQTNAVSASLRPLELIGKWQCFCFMVLVQNDL